MKTNRTLLLIDSLIFCSTIVLYVITSISNSIFGFYNFTINIILCLLSVAISVCPMIYSYHKKIYKDGVSFINLIVPVIYFLIVFFLYFLPALGFVGNEGVNNSICFLMTFTFGVRYLLIISQLIKPKSKDISSKIPKKSLDYSKNVCSYSYSFLKYFALFLFAVAILVSVINTFFLFMDLSKIFDNFSELNLDITFLGQKIN